jgi:hypothetical protein
MSSSLTLVGFSDQICSFTSSHAVLSSTTTLAAEAMMQYTEQQQSKQTQTVPQETQYNTEIEILGTL